MRRPGPATGRAGRGFWPVPRPFLCPDCIYPDGKVDPAHSSELDLRLTDGSFRLSIAALDKAFVKTGSHAPIYPKTCTDLISVTGTTPIVAGSGTGAYRGIRGGFRVTLTLNEVEARPCEPSPGAFRAQLITMAGSGTISFLTASEPAP